MTAVEPVAAAIAESRLIVHNTFISVAEETLLQENLHRTRSDPTGGSHRPQERLHLSHFSPVLKEELEEEAETEKEPFSPLRPTRTKRDGDLPPPGSSVTGLSPNQAREHPWEWLTSTPQPSPRFQSCVVTGPSSWEAVAPAATPELGEGWAESGGMETDRGDCLPEPEHGIESASSVSLQTVRANGPRGRRGKRSQKSGRGKDGGPPTHPMRWHASSSSTTASEGSHSPPHAAEAPVIAFAPLLAAHSMPMHELSSTFAGMTMAVAMPATCSHFLNEGATAPAVAAGSSGPMAVLAAAASTPLAGVFGPTPQVQAVAVSAGTKPAAPLTPTTAHSPSAQSCKLSCPPGAFHARRQGPPFGSLHRLHAESRDTGTLSSDGRCFTKENFGGRLSVITEDTVHSFGVVKYALRMTGGELSNADGVGFIFSTKLPCPKNIQRIVSIFANRTGKICVRANAEVVRSDIGIAPLQIGDWVCVTVDLGRHVADFSLWPASGSEPSSAASIDFAAALGGLQHRIPDLAYPSSGYFACVLKNLGVSVELGS